jgi:hypothetical protein
VPRLVPASSSAPTNSAADVRAVFSGCATCPGPFCDLPAEHMSNRAHGSPRTVYSPAVTAPLWVARLINSARTAEKLTSRHGLDWREVHDAIVCVRGLSYVWDDDPERGRRALVEVTIRGRLCLVVLYPVADPSGDVYALGSAYPR